MSLLLGFFLSALFVVLANVQAGAALPRARRQMNVGHAVSLVLALSLYAAFAALTARPVLALGLTLGASALLWAVNRLKMAVLHEPLVFSDVFLLGQVYRHPQLYVAHAPSGPRLYAALWTVVLVAIMALEPKNISLTPPSRVGLGLLALLPWVMLVAMLTGKARRVTNTILAAHDPGFDPNLDAARFTPLGAALLHALHHTRRLHNGMEDLLAATRIPAHARTGTERKPHVLLVQAESFCDIRRFAPEAGDDLFPNILRAMSQGRHGRLELDWSGAYTMRTEFSVLTGLDIRELETFGFDPYILAARRPIPSLAHALRKQGYRSICLHPYDPTFFQRDLVMRNLGFEQFLGLEHFSPADTNGPYVSDPCVLNAALDLLQHASEPLFVFVITMEAHGPWLPGRFADHVDTPLAHYLRHLRSLDAGVETVLRQGRELDRDLLFTLYGDHVPSLDVVTGETAASKATDYFIWTSRPDETARARKNMRPEELGNEILQAPREG